MRQIATPAFSSSDQSSAKWQAYFAWLQDRGQIWPTKSPAEVTPAEVAHEAPKEPGLRVGFVCATQTPVELDLLQKMLAAMQLNPQDFELASNSLDLLVRDPEILVFLGDEPHVAHEPQPLGQWYHVDSPTGAVAILKTYHPSVLLKTPALKREAWAHLQLIMERLRSS